MYDIKITTKMIRDNCGWWVNNQEWNRMWKRKQPHSKRTVRGIVSSGSVQVSEGTKMWSHVQRRVWGYYESLLKSRPISYKHLRVGRGELCWRHKSPTFPVMKVSLRALASSQSLRPSEMWHAMRFVLGASKWEVDVQLCCSFFLVLDS